MASTSSLMEIPISKHSKAEPSAKVPLLPVSHNAYSKSHAPTRCNNKGSSVPTIAKFTLELTLGPQAPVVELTGLTIHKFNVSETNLTAEWDVKLKIGNPNLVSQIWFDRLEGFVLYEDRTLAIEQVEPFGLPMKTKNQVRLRLRMANWEGDQPALKQGMLKKMKSDRKLGGVRFSVQMAVWATYRSVWRWSAQRVIMNPQCLDLQVAFVPGATAIGFGILIGDAPRTCYVPMLAE
ncbi:uncharacterized protein Pyn_06461 [Prunus yedoensis var. nudiflora]|uniref:Late embryogenesis abundant protein LEA-2 subgroup domain-containing protein n=1 Tax=Prunus yedoensis var. nudiflora TaxID=2094558 RepID=A0A314YU68_PRUYE|nr:uncharacterized protein Pyn_06461 [Prunus yedoensis var. nudiflora]